jgi:hypothetical protein
MEFSVGGQGNYVELFSWLGYVVVVVVAKKK